jgi:hypothetical protein
MSLLDLLPWRRTVEQQPDPLPEDEPLWVLVDRLLAGRVSRDERAYICSRVENWELRLENKRLRLDQLHRQAAANAAMVHKPPVTKPKVVVTRNHVRHGPKKRNRANCMRNYRNRLKLVTDNTPRGGDAA